jgi:hypothetical protein
MRRGEAMKLFGGKHQKEAAAGLGGAGRQAEYPWRVERRFTIGLTRAEQLAMMLAKSRAAKVVEVADMLAGMYIYEWDRLSRFWGEREEVEEFLRRICSISPQRWNYWIAFYDKQRQESVALSLYERARRAVRRNLRAGALRRGKGAKRSWSEGFVRAGSDAPWSSPIDAWDGESNLERSIELEEILGEAGEISPFRDGADGREVPVLTSECVLLCIAKNNESEVSRKLRETGLDLEALERAARDPRRAPHH